MPEFFIFIFRTEHTRLLHLFLSASPGALGRHSRFSDSRSAPALDFPIPSHSSAGLLSSGFLNSAHRLNLRCCSLLWSCTVVILFPSLACSIFGRSAVSGHLCLLCLNASYSRWRLFNFCLHVLFGVANQILVWHCEFVVAIL
jgi:hypothetical protein